MLYTHSPCTTEEGSELQMLGMTESCDRLDRRANCPFAKLEGALGMLDGTCASAASRFLSLSIGEVNLRTSQFYPMRSAIDWGDRRELKEICNVALCVDLGQIPDYVLLRAE